MRLSLREGEDFEASRKGVSVFDFQPGNKYHMVVLGEMNPQLGYDIEIMWMNAFHSRVLTEKGPRGFRCIKDHLEYEKLPDGSVHNDESGNAVLKKDPATGHVLFDGTCPICEAFYNYNQFFWEKFNKWKEENPDASDAEEKVVKQTLNDESPASKPEFVRAFLMAVFETDRTSGKPTKNADGTFRYTIQPVKVSKAAYDKKFKQAIDMVIADLSDEQLAAKDNGLVWHEFLFTYPEASDNVKNNPRAAKGDSAKNMSIQAITGMNSQILPKNPDLKEALKKQVSEVSLDDIEEKMKFFRPTPLPTLHKYLSAKATVIRDDMSEEDKARHIATLESGNANISAEEAKEVFAGKSPEASTSAPTPEPVVTEPVVTEPVVTEPVVAEPVVTEPVVTEPVVTEPVVTEPVVTEPVVAEPVSEALTDLVG